MTISLQSNTLVQELSGIGVNDVPLLNVDGVITWSTVTDTTTIPYALRTNLPNRIIEWGNGTKITTNGQAMLHRTAANVTAGSAGAGVLINFTSAVELIITVPGSTSAGAGGGSVSSVGLTVPSDETVSGSPVTGSGTLAITRNNQNANLVLAGPASGGAGAPAYRSLVAADLGTGTADASHYLTGALTWAAPVSSFNTRTGAITLTSSDVTSALGDANIAYTDVADTFTQQPRFNLGTVAPVDVAYAGLIGASQIGLISSHSTGVVVHTSGSISFIRLGSPLGSQGPLILIGYGGRGGGIWFESSGADSFGQDIPFLTTDVSNNLHLGNNGTFGGGNNDNNNTYFEVQTGKSQNWTENNVTVVSLVSSVLSVRAGLSLGPPLVSVGGSLFDNYADAATTLTSGTFEDLFTHTVLGSTLATAGDAISGTAGLIFVGSATATREVKLYFAGTAIFDTTALVSSATSNAILGFLIEMVNSTTVRYAVSIIAPGLASTVAPAVGELTGLTLASDNILKISAAAAATGAASGDITAKVQKIRYEKAAGFLAFPLSLLPTAWYKADAGTYQTSGGSPAVANNDPVGSWLDQGLSGNNMAQSTAGARPLLQTNYQNSLPVLLFDGVNSIMPSSINFGSTPFAYYMVAKVFTLNNNNAKLLGDAFNAYMLLGAGGATLYISAGTILGGITLSANTFYTFQGLFNGASSSVSVNGGTKTSGNAGTGGESPVTISPSGNLIHLAVGELLVFSRALLSSEETSLFSYLRTRWGHY